MVYSKGFGHRIILLIGLWLYLYSPVEARTETKPNIIFLMADDAGWNDFSFHGSPQIPTPNIDAMAFGGTILNSYYSAPLCTPTRGAVMTGKHPIHLRLQHFVIMGQTADGLSLKEKLLPQYLKELGYATHLVGKWHLGHSRNVFTPTQRGFDTHLGYRLGKQDYYDHFSLDGSKTGWGYDFWANLSVHYDVFGKYDTDIFTEEAIRLIHAHPKDTPLFLMVNHMAPHSGNAYNPLQAPKKYIEKFTPTIEDEKRRIYAAMVAELDDSVGEIVNALSSTGLLKNSIFIFVSDNGGAPEGYDLNYGSNWPLRGVKNTLWEGGTRVAGLLWSPFTQNRVSFDVCHAHDWVPTLYEAAGGQDTQRKFQNIDGKSMWKTFTKGVESPVETFLYNLDDIYNNSAIRHGKWKLIQGNTSTRDLGGGIWDFWYGPTGRNQSVHDLIPGILSSRAGIALQKAGFGLNEARISELQLKAEVLCNSTSDLACNPYQRPCLFNLETDPCEKNNVADLNPDVVKQLLELMDKYNKTALPPIPRVKDPVGLPSNWGYVWSTWKDFTDPMSVNELIANEL